MPSPCGRRPLSFAPRAPKGFLFGPKEIGNRSQFEELSNPNNGHRKPCWHEVSDLKVFLSYSSHDKDIAQGLADAIGQRAVWFDQFEVELGDLLLERISRGLEEATDFVLLWSANSAASKWVKYEVNMALIRNIEDSGCRIRTVLMDQTPVPLLLKPYVFMDCSSTPSDVPVLVLQALEGVEDRQSGRRRYFINRHDVIGRIETSIDTQTFHAIVLVGMYGIGKRSVVENAVLRLFTKSPVIYVGIKPGFDLVNLAITLASEAMTEIPPEDTDIVSSLHFALERLYESGKTVCLLNSQHWVQEDGRASSDLEQFLEVCHEISPLRERPVFITSTRRFSCPIRLEQVVQTVWVERMETDHLSAIIKYWLEIEGGKRARHDSERVDAVAQDLFGYPLAGRLAAGLIARRGIEYLEEHPKDIADLRVEVAKNLIAQVALSDDAGRLMRLISAADAPFSSSAYTEVLGFDEERFASAVKDASDAGLISYSDGVLSVHPLVHDYYYRRLDQLDDATLKALAEGATRELTAAQVGSVRHAHLLGPAVRLVALSGDFEGARQVRRDLLGQLISAVRELYQGRKYDLAVQYSEEILAERDDWEVRYYLARSLTRLERTVEAHNVLNKMLEERPKDVRVMHAIGRVEFEHGDPNVALQWFTRALSVDEFHVSSLRDASECLLRLDRLQDAEGYIRRALREAPRAPFVLLVEAQIWAKKSEYARALSVMQIAVRYEPDNPRFLSFAGEIAKETGSRRLALQYLRQSLKIRDDSRTKILLADLLADEGDVSEAEALLKGLDGQRGSGVSRVRAKVALVSQRFDDAVREASRLPMVTVEDYILRSRIEFARAEAAVRKGYREVSRRAAEKGVEIAEEGLRKYHHSAELRDVLDALAQLMRRLA